MVEIFNAEQLEPRDKALILALLAQAEATLELVDLIKAGVSLASRRPRVPWKASRPGCLSGISARAIWG